MEQNKQITEYKKVVKSGPHKIVIIPKHSQLTLGDYVKITKIGEDSISKTEASQSGELVNEKSNS